MKSAGRTMATAVTAFVPLPIVAGNEAGGGAAAMQQTAPALHEACASGVAAALAVLAICAVVVRNAECAPACGMAPDGCMAAADAGEW